MELSTLNREVCLKQARRTLKSFLGNGVSNFFGPPSSFPAGIFLQEKSLQLKDSYIGGNSGAWLPGNRYGETFGGGKKIPYQKNVRILLPNVIRTLYDKWLISWAFDLYIWLKCYFPVTTFSSLAYGALFCWGNIRYISGNSESMEEYDSTTG